MFAYSRVKKKKKSHWGIASKSILLRIILLCSKNALYMWNVSPQNSPIYRNKEFSTVSLYTSHLVFGSIVAIYIYLDRIRIIVIQLSSLSLLHSIVVFRIFTNLNSSHLYTAPTLIRGLCVCKALFDIINTSSSLPDTRARRSEC